MTARAVVVAALALAASTAVQADDQPICADRPGKSSQACTVPAGHWQIESSLVDWTLNRESGERDTSLAIGEFDLKFALSGRSHIDVGITPWQRGTSSVGGVHERVSGIGDALVMFKENVSRAESPLQVAISPFVKVPTARRPLGNRKWEGGLVVPVQYQIGKSPFSLAMTPELDWNADADGRGRHIAMAQVANLGWQATQKLNLSGEIWGQWDWDPAGTIRQASVDGAAAYLVNAKLQLDAGANIGLNRATPDVELYAGIARQF
jgi:hypothetical protein